MHTSACWRDLSSILSPIFTHQQAKHQNPHCQYGIFTFLPGLIPYSHCFYMNVEVDRLYRPHSRIKRSCNLSPKHPQSKPEPQIHTATTSVYQYEGQTCFIRLRAKRFRTVLVGRNMLALHLAWGR